VSEEKSNMHLDYTFKFQYNDMKKQAEGIKSRRVNGIHTWHRMCSTAKCIFYRFVLTLADFTRLPILWLCWNMRDIDEKLNVSS
jgi:hypothetical protein